MVVRSLTSPRSSGSRGSARIGGWLGSAPRARPACSTGRRVRTAVPRRTPAEVEQRVLAAARATNVVARTGSVPSSGVPARTVSAILRRHQVPYLRECDPLTGEVIRASKTTAVRYERDHPGVLVHMDVKKVGRIPDGGGWKAHGREHGQTAKQKRAGSGSTTSTHSSTTTPGWPTPRSCPTRRAPPAQRSCSAPRPTSPATASPASSE